MAIKEYFRNLGIYEANSINSFMKRAKINNVKTVDVIIEYLYLNKSQKEDSNKGSRLSAFSNIDTRITYEARPRGYSLKTRFSKVYTEQYDALECTAKKIEWLKNKLGLEDENIVIKNSDRKTITNSYYPMMLKAAKKYHMSQSKKAGNTQ